MSTKRIEWIDLAKGAGMLLVILGHALPYGGVLCRLIFAFHMPLFFVLSGMVYKDISVKDLLVKRSRSLLLPYALFCLLGTAIALLTGEFTVSGFLSDMYYGNPEHIYVSSVWFLIALFGVLLLFWLIRKIKNVYIQYGVLMILLGIGFVFGYLFNHGTLSRRLPLDLDVVPVAAAFFACGFYLKKLLTDAAEKLKKASLPLCFAVIAGTVVVLGGATALNHSVNLHAITYHNPGLYLIASAAGSMALILVCAKLEGTVPAKPLKWLGENTIYLLGGQAIGIRLSVSLINSLFHQDFALYCLPYSYAAIAFVTTTVFAVLFTVIIKAVWGLIRQKGAKAN